MKMSFSPAGTKDSIVIEGTASELEVLIFKILNSNSFQMTLQPATTSPAAETSPTVENNFHLMDQFLNSLYVYSSTPDNTSGRSRYIAEQLFDGKLHSVSSLVAISNSSSDDTVYRTIRKLREAGASISISGDADPMVQLHSILNKRYIRLHRQPQKPVLSQSKTKVKKSSTSNSVISALSSFRIS